jgi:hypothetical protein
MVVNMRANKCHICLLLDTLSKQEVIFLQSVMLSGLMTVILPLYSPYFGSSHHALSLLHFFDFVAVVSNSKSENDILRSSSRFVMTSCH